MTASPAPPRTPAQLLEAALRADPARALLTFYDDATGERTELSVATFANWVAKTANLCRDELGLEVGASVAIALPAHWQAAVWWQACWASGFLASPAESGSGTTYDVAVVAVGAEGEPDGPVPRATDVVGLGLGPMGLPAPGRPAPAGVTLDYDREVHGHGDRFQPAGALDGSVPALRAEGDTLGAGALGERVAEAAGRWGLGPADRVLTASPYGSLASLLSGLLVPLHSGAGVVLCRNPDLASDDMLARRVVQEGVTAVTGERRFGSFGARRLD